MRHRMFLAAVLTVASLAGCRHHCNKWCSKKDGCCPSSGGSSNILLPPAGVPTTPGGPAPSPFPPPADVRPGPSYFAPPATVPTPLPPKADGPKVLLPDTLPGNPSSRVTKPSRTSTNFLGAPVKPTAEPPKASPVAGLPATKVKDGFYAGARPTLAGFDSLKNAGFRSVIFLHGAGADVAAVKDMASTRDLNFVAIEVTPETLAEASKQFDRAAADRIHRPAYVFADEPVRAGALWYLHFRNAGALGDDVARLRAKPLGFSTQGEDGQALTQAIQKMLEEK